MENSFDKFFNELIGQTKAEGKNLSVDELRATISRVNEYFFTTHPNIGITHILDQDFEYFSEYHKFWEKYHKRILEPKIDNEKCSKIADILNEIYIKTDARAFTELYETYGLKEEEICKVRYFSANQDFRGSRNFKELSASYSDDPTIFEKEKIAESPEDYLKQIGITGLSQSDKRVKYAVTSAQMLIEKNIEPYDLYKFFNKDLLKIREFLIGKQGSGFGNKKADMFIRDMVVLKVWRNPINFDKIDVASDINTIKVALRTGIIKTEIPLVTSFLDIFCYQYSLIDSINANAWRRVWEIWKEKYPKTSVDSPCLIDYLVYRIIGKDFCKESLCVFKCDSGKHEFKWHSGRNRTCQVCKKEKAQVVKKLLPCSDKDGSMVIEKSEFVSGPNAVLPGIKECPFESVCKPKEPTFRKLNPPKSISILGQTGWDNSRTTEGEGGGGMMS